MKISSFLLHPLVIILLTLLLAAAATFIYALYQETNTPTTWEATPQLSLTASQSAQEQTSTSALLDLAKQKETPNLSELQSILAAQDTLEWLQWQADKNQPVPENLLVFTLKGRKVKQVQKNQQYFLADENAYRHFAPKNIAQAARLQLPNTPVTPVADEGVFIIPADTWEVPADIPNQITYTVNFAHPRFEYMSAPAGTLVNDVFTLWIKN